MPRAGIAPTPLITLDISASIPFSIRASQARHLPASVHRRRRFRGRRCSSSGKCPLRRNLVPLQQLPSEPRQRQAAAASDFCIFNHFGRLRRVCHVGFRTGYGHCAATVPTRPVRPGKSSRRGEYFLPHSERKLNGAVAMRPVTPTRCFHSVALTICSRFGSCFAPAGGHARYHGLTAKERRSGSARLYSKGPDDPV